MGSNICDVGHNGAGVGVSVVPGDHGNRTACGIGVRRSERRRVTRVTITSRASRSVCISSALRLGLGQTHADLTM